MKVTFLQIIGAERVRTMLLKIKLFLFLILLSISFPFGGEITCGPGVQGCASSGYYMYSGKVIAVYQKGTTRSFAKIKSDSDNLGIWVNFPYNSHEFLSLLISQKSNGSQTTVYYIKAATCYDVPWEENVCNELQFIKCE